MSDRKISDVDSVTKNLLKVKELIQGSKRPYVAAWERSDDGVCLEGALYEIFSLTLYHPMSRIILELCPEYHILLRAGVNKLGEKLGLTTQTTPRLRAFSITLAYLNDMCGSKEEVLAIVDDAIALHLASKVEAVK